MGDCDPGELTAQCKRLARGLSSLHDGNLKDWQPVAACVNAAMLFLALDVTQGGTRPVLSDRSRAVAWWRDWAKHEASEALLKVLRAALAAAPLVIQASTKDEAELRQVVTAAVTDMTLMVSDVLRDIAMRKWPRLQDDFIIREHGFTRMVHAMLAVLPVSSTMPTPYLALDATLDFAKTFDRISAGLAAGTTKAMGNSNAEMHSRFLTESSSLLHHLHSSCHIEVLVTEWCRWANHRHNHGGQ
jgi:hypothetical protein